MRRGPPTASQPDDDGRQGRKAESEQSPAEQLQRGPLALVVRVIGHERPSYRLGFDLGRFTSVPKLFTMAVPCRQSLLPALLRGQAWLTSKPGRRGSYRASSWSKPSAPAGSRLRGAPSPKATSSRGASTCDWATMRTPHSSVSCPATRPSLRSWPVSR